MQELLKKLLFGNAGGGNGGAPSLSMSFTDGGTFDPRITFSRGTNATLTGSNGLIQYAPHNLLTNSEDFEAAAWTKDNVTITANASTSPDGTLTADAIVENAANNVHRVNQGAISAVAGVTYTFSVYVKKESVDFFQLAPSSAQFGAGTVMFNIATGTVVTGSGAISPAGNGWYRCSYTATAIATGTALVYLNPSDSSVSVSYQGVNGRTSIFIWGAQLNVGALQTYNSTTPKNLLGFTQEPENAAWTKSNSYVQQNLLPWSQDFDNAAWSKNNGSVTSTSVIAPDGTSTADTFTADGTNTGHFVRQSITLLPNTTYTATMYAKPAGNDWGYLFIAGTGAGNSSTFNYATGSVGSIQTGLVSRAIVPAGNGWYRVSITFTTGATVGSNFFEFSTSPIDQTGAIVTSGGLSVWGAQLVQGADAGQYTQTTSAAAVTRYTNWDGTLTGRKLVEDTATSAHSALQTVSVIAGTTYTASAFVKAGERTLAEVWVLNNLSTIGAGIRVDLSNGTFVSQRSVGGSTLSSYAITAAGGGWYRISVAVIHNSTSGGAFVAPIATGTATSTITYTGDGTSGIYVSDFQLANSASVDAYVYNPQAAAASAAFYGPRIDYDPVTLASRGLLIEEQRTNLLLRSEEFNTGSWTVQNVSITANTATAPDGNTTADTIGAATGATAFVNQGVTGTSGTTYTWSVWLRGINGGETVKLFLDGGLTGGTAVSPLFTLTTTWTRYTLTGTASASTAIGYAYVLTGTTYGCSGQAVYVWGAQLEAGAFATSYIPTVASQVTRNADSASMLGDNFYTWYNPNQGTLYTEGGGLNAAGSARLAGISDGTFSNRIINYLAGGPQVAGLISAGGVAQANPVVNVTSAAAANKLAQGYFVNNVNIAANGTLGTLDTVATIPAVTLMRIGADEVGTGAILNGTIRSIRYYTVRLPDATLQQITS